MKAGKLCPPGRRGTVGYERGRRGGATDHAALYEKVHTKADLVKFLDMARKDPSISYIHFIGHGDLRGDAKLRLTFESVNLRENAEIFANLQGKLLIFSCCVVGSDRAAMERVLTVSKATAIISYNRNIDDAYAFVSEALLYSRLLDTRWRPREIVRKVKAALRGLKVSREAGVRNTRSPLVCFSAK